MTLQGDIDYGLSFIQGVDPVKGDTLKQPLENWLNPYSHFLPGILNISFRFDLI
jgi:hypothetical protein